MDVEAAFTNYLEYRAEVIKLEREIKRRRRPDATLQRVLARQLARRVESEDLLKQLGFDVATGIWTGTGACPPQAALV
jgi:hypothetical protein